MANADSYTLTGEELRLALEAIRMQIISLEEAPAQPSTISRLARLQRLSTRLAARITA